MDTAFPLSEEQVAKQNTDLQAYAEEVATPPSQPAKPLVDENANVVLLNSNPTGTDRSFKGFGNLTAYPTVTDVQKLRQNQNDPDMQSLFDSMYGSGSSKRYTNYPSLGDVTKLLQNKDDPEFVKLFDRTYGDLSRMLVPLYDPRTSADTKQVIASHLNFVLHQGRSWADDVLDNSAVQAVESVGVGIEAAGKELARSAASGVDYVAGTDLASGIPSSADTRLNNHPIVDGVISGVSQFLTGRLLLNPIGGGKQLGALGTTIREMSLGAFVDAFAFNPDDPLIGDMAKQLGMGDNWFTKLDSIENFQSDAAKRGARAAEGGVVGLGIDLLVKAYRGVKAFRAGDVKAAEAAKNEVAEVVKQIEEKQLELPLGDNLPSQVEPSFANKGLMDMPVERRLDEVPGLKTAPAETAGEMQYRLMDKWGVDHQLKLDLGEPKEGAFIHGREAGQQGELFPTNGPQKSAAGEPAQQLDLFAPEAPPKGYSRAEVLDTSREQFIKDAIEDNPPIVRETKSDIEGPRQPRTELPQNIRDVLDNITDFSNYSLAAIRANTAPLLNDFLRITKNSASDIERIAMSELHPQDVQKIQALTSMGMKKAEDAAAEAGAKLEAFKKAKVTDAKEIEALRLEVKEANSFIADLQKVDLPLSTFAGRLLQQRQLEARLTASRRVDVADMRSRGVSDERINELIRAAMDHVDQTRLSELNHDRLIALNKGDAKTVAKLDEEIGKEMLSVAKQADSQFTNFHTQIVKDIASFTISNILSGFGTTFRNIAGIFGHVPLYRANQLMGAIDEHGLVDGTRAYAMEVKARRMALRYGFQSTLDTLSATLGDAAGNAFKGESKNSVKGMGNPHRISADNYGMTGKAGPVLNAFGKGVELLTLPLRFSDEVASDILGRHAIGTRAAFNFFENLQAQKDLLKAQLRDPKLTAAERKAFEAKLDTFKGKNPTAEIDGQVVSLKDHVEAQVKQAYDGEGRLVDPHAIDDVNYLLLRNRQTPSAMGQAIEKGVNSSPYMRFLVPVFNAPMNGFKRGFETVPGLRKMGLTDLKAELESVDPYVRSMARGKLGTAYAITGSALLLADGGFITRGTPTGRDQRLSDQASSSPGPYQLKIGNTHWELSGLDPISVPFIWAAEFTDAVRKYNAALDQKVEIQNAKGEPISVMEARLEQMLNVGLGIMGATGSAIMANPALSGLKDVVDTMGALVKASEDEHAFSKEATKLTRGQLGKLVPNAYKQMLGLFDSKRYDPATAMDVLNAAAGDNRATPMLYDVMGRPIENKSPTRSLLGPMAAVRTPDKDSKAQYVIDTLHNWGEVTGRYYTFDTTPPDPVLKKYGIDLRTIPSLEGNRKVQDQFANNYRDLSIRGATVDEALYTIVSNAVKTGLPVGNKQERNPDLFGAIDKVVSEYKSIAWEVTLRQEFAKKNSPLFKQINSAYAMKYAAQDPLFDRPDNKEIQTRTREMLRLFPQ